MLRKLQEAICEALEVCKKDKKYSHFFFFFVRRIEPKKVDLCTNSIYFIYSQVLAQRKLTLSLSSALPFMNFGGILDYLAA